MDLETYKKRALWPLAILSLIFAVAFVASSFRLEFATNNNHIFRKLDDALWVVFAIDYFIMLFLSPKKWKFIRTHVLDLILVAFPFFRILRVLRLVVLIARVAQTFRAKFYLTLPYYAVGAGSLLVILGSAAIYDIEYGQPGAQIKSPADALWWAVVTVTTVGYGDVYPVTHLGRLLGTGMILCGVALVGTITASFAGWVISQIREVENESSEIKKELQEIKDLLKSRDAGVEHVTQEVKEAKS
jgi:voltage-gated potassium channel